MSYIDTHTHLYKEYYPEDIHSVVKRAIHADVTKMILPAVNADSISDIFEISNQYPENLYPLVGLHPTDVLLDFKNQLHRIEEHIDDEGIVGIGEVGIDLYHSTEYVEQQKEAFSIQLGWAKDLHLPLSIHIRDAYSEAISVIKEFKNTTFSGVFHCFSGGIQEAKWAVDNGFYLGISGVVTYKKSKLPDLIKEIGLEHLVLETDSPFLAPEPNRGKTNESSYIPFIAKRLSAIFELPIEEIQRITTQNALRVFTRLNP